MTCQCRLALINKCPTLVSDVGNRGVCRCMGTDLWEIPVPPSQFGCKSKTALKKGLKKKKELEDHFHNVA